RGLAPRALDVLLAHVLQARQVVDAGAADDAEDGLGHAPHPAGCADHPPRKRGGIKAHACPCTSAHTFFLVKYMSPAKMSRKIITWKPMRLRASRCGSAAHIMNAATSLAYWSIVAGLPSLYSTRPSV